MLWIIRSNTSVTPLWTPCEPEPESLPGKCRSSLWWSDTHFFPSRAPKHRWHLDHLCCTTGLMRAAVSVQRARQELASVSCLVICLTCWTLLLRRHQGPRQQGPPPRPRSSFISAVVDRKRSIYLTENHNRKRKTSPLINKPRRLKRWTKVAGTKKDCLYVCLGLLVNV